MHIVNNTSAMIMERFDTIMFVSVLYITKSHHWTMRIAACGASLSLNRLSPVRPRRLIAFINVACSGAEIYEGIIVTQEKRGLFQDENSPPILVKPQGDQVHEWLGNNHYEKLNIAMFSIGGNDIGFGPTVRNFLIVPSGNLVGTDSEASKTRGNLKTAFASKLPEAYDTLKPYMDAHFDYDAVLVTAYPIPLAMPAGIFVLRPGGRTESVGEQSNQPITRANFDLRTITF